MAILAVVNPPAALQQTGDGGRLEAYPTGYLPDLGRPEIALATPITAAARPVKFSIETSAVEY